MLRLLLRRPTAQIERRQLQAFAPVLYALSLGLFVARLLVEFLQKPTGTLWALITAASVAASFLVVLAGHRHCRLSPLLLLLIYVLWPRLDPALACAVAVACAVAILHSHALVRREAVWDASVVLLSLGLYIRTLAPTILPADSGEFQFVSYVLGIAHPPGYPLYTMLGKLFTLLPVGDVAYRVNLFAAVTSALTLMVLNRTVRQSTGSPLAGWLAASLLGVAPTFWAQSTTANIRSLTALFTSLQISACLAYARTRDARHLSLFAVALGLGVTHHSSNLPLVLPYAAFLAVSDPALVRRPTVWWKPLGLFAATFAVWLYLPMRSALGAPFDSQPIRTVSGFLEHVLALGFRGDMFYFVRPTELVSRSAVLLNILRLEFGSPGVWLVLAGILAAIGGHGAVALLCGGTFVVNAVLAITYRAPQTVEYLMPGYVALACAGATGVWSIVQRLPKPSGRTLLLATVFIFPVLTLQQAYPSFLQLSRDRSARDYAEGILRQAPQGTQVLSNWHHATPLWYLQYVEHLRPDVQVTYVYPEGATPNAEVWLRRMAESSAQRPTIVTNYFAEFSSAPYVLRPFAGSLLVVTQPAASLPSAAQRLDIQFGDLIQFVGVDLEGAEASPSDHIRLRMYWQPVVRLQRDYSFFVHLVDRNGSILGQGDIHQPATQYAPGQVVQNEFDIPLLPTTVPGAYRLIAGVYFTPKEGSWERLTTAQGADSFQVAQVTVRPLASAPVTAQPQLRPSDAGYTLVGVDYDHSVPGQLRVYLHWQKRTGQTSPAQVVLRSSQGVLVRGSLPQLPIGTFITTAYDIPGGQRGLRLQVKPEDSEMSHVWRGPWWMAARSELGLPDPAPGQRYVPLGNEMVLTRADYPAHAVSGTGVVVRVSLVGARPIVHDYSVSMSLRAEAGDWQAQDDGTPAMGAIPTLKWIRGTRVADEHILPLASRAAGRAALRLAVYDAFTLRLLPVLDDRLARAGQGTQMQLGTVEVQTASFDR